jgi:hypothetical protein
MMSSPAPSSKPPSDPSAFGARGGSGLETRIDAYAAALSQWLQAWYHAEEARRSRTFTWQPRQRRLILAMAAIFGPLFALLIVLHRFVL